MKMHPRRSARKSKKFCRVESLENRELFAADFGFASPGFAVPMGAGEPARLVFTDADSTKDVGVFDSQEQGFAFGMADWGEAVIYHGTDTGQHFGFHQVDAFFASNGDQTSIADWQDGML